MHLKKHLLSSFILIVLAMGLTNCKSNKISCPAYGGGGGTPGAIPKGSKTTSGVMPGDGHGSHTRVPR